jgi:hypothetical protein
VKPWWKSSGAVKTTQMVAGRDGRVARRSSGRGETMLSSRSELATILRPVEREWSGVCVSLVGGEGGGERGCD